VALRDAWNAIKYIAERAEAAETIQIQFEELFQRMAEPISTTELRRLIIYGANPYQQIIDSKIPIAESETVNCLHMAAYYGKAELLTLALDQMHYKTGSWKDVCKNWRCKQLPHSTCFSLRIASWTS
jgi:hypothetical protein